MESVGQSSPSRDNGQERCKAEYGLDISLFLNLVGFSIVVVAYYLSREDCIYFSDMGTYQDMTRYYAGVVKTSLVSAANQLWHSTSLDYNGLYTIPLIPLLYLFGDTRVTFILGVTLVYGLTYALAAGATASCLVQENKKAVFWMASFLALFTPAVWTPTLVGYPDAGAGMLIAVAVWLYIRKEPGEIRVWSMLATGIFIGAAMLYRRHFAYGAAAFYAALGVHLLVWQYGHQQSTTEREKHPDKRIPLFMQIHRGVVFKILAVILAGTFLFLCTAGYNHLRHLLTLEIMQLNKSFERPVLEQVQYFGSRYGIIPLLLSFLGLFLAPVMRGIRKSAALFLALFGLSSWLVWLLKGKCTGPHYCFHFNLFYITGLIALFIMAWNLKSVKIRLAAWGSLGFILLVNLFIGFIPVNSIQESSTKSWLFAHYIAPMKTASMDEIRRLVDDLRQETSEKTILVAPYANELSFEILEAAEMTMYGPENRKLNVLSSQVVDSRDRYPIEIYHADYIVSATPFLHFLPESETDVTRVLYEALEKRWPIAEDFERLPQNYQLGNFTVYVYRRVRPVSIQIAVDTLNRMISEIGSRPGRTEDWISLRKFLINNITPEGNGKYYIETHVGNAGTDSTNVFAFVGQLPQKPAVMGVLTVPNSQSEGARLLIMALDQTGKILETKTVACRSTEECAFNESFSVPNPAMIALEIVTFSDTASVDYGRTEIHGLEIKPSE